MRPIDADALQKAIDSLPISPLTQEVFKGHVDAAIANAPTVAKDTNVLSNGWISVKDRLPEEDGKYLCVWQGMSIETGLFINGHFRLYGEIKDKLVTHWMPMPEMPEEDPYGSGAV